MTFVIAFLLSGWLVAADRPAIPLTFPNGVVIQVEVAQTPIERATGLMNRQNLSLDRGMLFVFDKPDFHFFWMKDTLLPLDMIWLDSDKRILHIEEQVPPCKKDPCPAYGPPMKSLYVLEVNAGVVQRQGLSVGAFLRFDLPNSPP